MMSRERERERGNDDYYHTNGFVTKLLIITLIASTIILPLFVVIQMAYGFDVVPTVDPTNKQLLTVGTPNIYRFGTPVTKNVTYSDDSVVPSMTMSIEQYNQTSKQWEIVGATNTHLHKLKVDTTDKFDISLGHTDRFNPKTVPPIAPPSIVD